MVATIEMLQGKERERKEYAASFLRRTGDMRRLQAILASDLPASEVMRLAMYERELRIRKQ